MTEIQLRVAPTYALVETKVELQLRAAPTYALIADPDRADIRSVRLYAALKTPEVSDVRSVRMYAIVKASPIEKLRLDGATTLLAAINTEHSKTLTFDQISFNDPVNIVDLNYNSKVTLVAAHDFMYSGTMDMRYNRFDLIDLFQGLSLTLPTDTVTTIHGRLAKINTTFDCNLKPRDVVDGPVAANATSLTLTVASGSFLFIPGTKVTLTAT